MIKEEVERVPSFEIVQQGLERHTRPDEDGGTAHDGGIAVDGRLVLFHRSLPTSRVYPALHPPRRVCLDVRPHPPTLTFARAPAGCRPVFGPSLPSGVVDLKRDLESPA